MIKTEFLDPEIRDWLIATMDLAPDSGQAVALGLEVFRKHARVVRRCDHGGRVIRGNAFFRHSKRCNRRNVANGDGLSAIQAKETDRNRNM